MLMASYLIWTRGLCCRVDAIWIEALALSNGLVIVLPEYEGTF